MSLLATSRPRSMVGLTGSRSIGTLNDLLATGDHVEVVEGVFSGTLSAIFNEWSQPGQKNGPKFSDVVKLAKAKGYTEPHPGDDLNGSDVARKLCIIARLIEGAGSQVAASLPDGYRSVPTESLVPEALAGEGSGEAFVEKLAAHDDHFDRLRQDAASRGCVLRYVGVVKASPNGACEVRASLQRSARPLRDEAPSCSPGFGSYPASHPFAASLGGSDNIVLFKTARYSPRPMIVQGAGAGAAVTAMGVVADIIRAAERVGAVSV